MNNLRRQIPCTCSVIIPAYNSAPYIRQALDSLLLQTFIPDEIIVVNNGSNDETGAIVEKFGHPIRLLQEPRKGASFARNRGIYEARGDLIAFHDADDISMPRRIEKQRQLFIDNPGTVLVFSAMEYTDEKLHPSGSLARCENFSQKGFWGQLLERNQIGSTSVAMVRRSQLLDAGGFDVNITHNEEYDLWLRLALLYPVKYLDEILVHYRIHKKNISHQRKAQRINEKKALDKYTSEHIRKALIKAFPDNPCRQKIALARVLIRKDDLVNARGLLKEVLKECTINMDAAFLLGVCHQLSGQLKEAEYSYHMCLENDKKMVENYNNLGVIATIEKNIIKASKHFEKAIFFRKNYSDPRWNLCIINNSKFKVDYLRITLNTLRSHIKPT